MFVKQGAVVSTKFLSSFLAIPFLGTGLLFNHSILAAEEASADLTISGGITVVTQSVKYAIEDPTLAKSGTTLSVDLNFEKAAGDGKVFVYINSSEGTDAFSGSNGDYEGLGEDEDGNRIEGFSDSRIAEAWYEHPITDTFTVTLGKISPQGIYDTNEFANDHTTQFLGAPFINTITIDFPGSHSPVHAYPAGITVAAALSESFTANIAVFEDAQSDYGGSFAHTFVIGEIDYATELFGGDANIRLLTWQSNLMKTTGFAVSYDQTIGESLGVFVRYGSRSLEKDTASEEPTSSVALGGQYTFGEGFTFGLGLSSITPQETTPDIEKESWTEAYISYELGEGVAVSLDYQAIKNPGFDVALGSVSVISGRLQVDF